MRIIFVIIFYDEKIAKDFDEEKIVKNIEMKINFVT